MALVVKLITKGTGRRRGVEEKAWRKRNSQDGDAGRASVGGAQTYKFLPGLTLALRCRWSSKMTNREDHETSGVYTRRFRDTAITDVPRVADVERVQPSNRQAFAGRSVRS